MSVKRATLEELDLLNKLKGMTFQKRVEVCALMLLGRSTKEEDTEPVSFKDLIEEAERVGKEGIVHYLFEKPLDDYLRDGLLKTFP